MKLWTVQTVEVLDKINSDGVYHCDPSRSVLLTEESFSHMFVPAYDWMAEQMKKQIGPAPDGVRYPIWAYYMHRGRQKKPDLRCAEFIGKCYDEPPRVLITLDIDPSRVLLSDMDKWTFVLNCWWLPPSDATIEDKDKKIKLSWNNIFRMDSSRYVQATFWEIRREDVVHVEYPKRWNRGLTK